MNSPQYTPMSCPAPRRCSDELPGGTWASHAWTAEDVKKYKAIGGWFVKGHHDFADRAAAIAAGVSPEESPEVKVARHAARTQVGPDKLIQAYNKLSAEEQSALLEKLR